MELSQSPSASSRPRTSSAHAVRVPSDRYALAALMASMGVLHFVLTETFASMMPAQIPAHVPLVLVSGAIEIALAAGLLVPSTRRIAGYALMALFIAVFPANISMAVHPELPLVGVPVQAPAFMLWLRLPLQFVLVGWAYRHARLPV